MAKQDIPRIKWTEHKLHVVQWPRYVEYFMLMVLYAESKLSVQNESLHGKRYCQNKLFFAEKNFSVVNCDIKLKF